MSLTDEINQEPQRWTRERVTKALGKEADEFWNLIADQSVSIPALWRALKRRGITPTPAAMRNWRGER